ncbi:hypothetical protein GB931_08435 [Modestobacter sp. I12A-02628]|uniref:Uncharacterized protein n=1 Tax=Goekera deserti TaxID=2497753 RepID=A0A7K3WF69_9ACTN|nr:hypothetical protein [Goekera deserti]MPQ97949.1 hypothetical protein [Goekera deserti]NDI48595.1 hypothetical protein [Goekera deserti]NEL55026.1 hypothetical protein [Goekera deserti]
MPPPADDDGADVEGVALVAGGVEVRGADELADELDDGPLADEEVVFGALDDELPAGGVLVRGADEVVAFGALDDELLAGGVVVRGADELELVAGLDEVAPAEEEAEPDPVGTVAACPPPAPADDVASGEAALDDDPVPAAVTLSEEELPEEELLAEADPAEELEPDAVVGGVTVAPAGTRAAASEPSTSTSRPGSTAKGPGAGTGDPVDGSTAPPPWAWGSLLPGTGAFGTGTGPWLGPA